MTAWKQKKETASEAKARDTAYLSKAVCTDHPPPNSHSANELINGLIYLMKLGP